MFLEKQLGNGCAWINLDLDKLKKLEDLSEIYGLDKETIEYALDRNERAHMDYHRENGTVTFIYNVLNLKKDKAYYEAFPMTFIVEHRRLITISNTKNAYVIEQMTRYLESHDTLSIYKFLFASLEIISNAYYPVIEQMDKSKDEVNGLLRQRTTKKIFLRCPTWRLVWFTSLQLPSKIACCWNISKGMPVYRSFNEIEREQFDDAMIEAHQLVSMTDLISQVLQQLSASYNNILNNNLNDNLTTLTIISVLLAVLAVVTGFFGMNVPLPLTDEPHAWLYISLASAGLWIVLSLLLRKIAKKKLRKGARMAIENYMPDFAVEAVYDLTVPSLQAQGIKAVLVDLDNTLIAWNNPDGTPEMKQWLHDLRDAGIRIIVVSNNTKKRVQRAVEKFGIDYVYWALKPFTFGIDRAMKEFHYEKSEVVMVGDQLMTDIRAAHRAGIRSILVKPLVQHDSIKTQINRARERHVMRKITEKYGPITYKKGI